MHILITGANGYLGQHLCNYFAGKLYAITATGRGERRIPKNIFVRWVQADITNEQQAIHIIQSAQPDVLIHTAAMSKPDECLQQADLAYSHNVLATRYLVRAYQNLSLPAKRFIYLSSDFIFGNNGPHRETDEPAPLNYYGETKWLAEQELSPLDQEATIVRPVFIYGPVWPGIRPGFIQWIAESLAAGKTIRVVNDQYRTPTFAPDICAGIEQIIKGRHSGIWHLAGSEIITPFDMACTIAKLLLQPENLIIPVSSDSFLDTVIRPKSGGLKIDKAIELLGYKPRLLMDGLQLSFGTH